MLRANICVIVFQGYLPSADKSPRLELTCPVKEPKTQEAKNASMTQSNAPESQQQHQSTAGQRVPTIKLNSIRELQQRSKGAEFRVSVHNVAYTVVEEDIIQIVNGKGEYNNSVLTQYTVYLG